jgi:gamma-glutamylcyclotransferase (GGCT)/AIG2-like uncharacterized protein YtfP
MRQDRVRYMFVYGTLMATATSIAGVNERKIIQKHCEFVGVASVRGVLFDVGIYPGAVLTDAGRDRVHGEIWALPTHRAEMFDVLDLYEGCGPTSAKPHMYNRRKVQVRAGSGRRVVAWTYLWNGSVAAHERIVNGRWNGPRQSNVDRLSDAVLLAA